MENNSKMNDTIPKRKQLPKGVSETLSGKYSACIQFHHGKNLDKHHSSVIGIFESIKEAVEARKNFITKLL